MTTTEPHSATPGLEIDRDGAVVRVLFNRPERRNAFTRAMYQGLRDLCAELSANPAVRVLVLRGAGGKAFAAGNEISDFTENDPVEYEEWIRELLATIAALPQITVAAVDGACVGGGLAVATHCDLRVATPSARFGFPIARTLGNALSAPVLYRCAAIFGESLTKEMLLAARLIDAERAYAVGALMSVTDDLDAELDVLVESLLAASGGTQRAAKTQLSAYAQRTEQAPDGDETMLRAVYAGPDFTEGVRAFLAKERPRFGG